MSTAELVPGMTGTPARSISSRALVFDPIASIASGGGPTNTRPAAAQARANAAFSARNPNPGCTASAPLRRAVRTIVSDSR